MIIAFRFRVVIMFHLNKIKTGDGRQSTGFTLLCLCRGVAQTCVYIHRSFQIWLWRSIIHIGRKGRRKGYLFPNGSFNWPIKNPYVSSSPILYRKHLRTKPNLTTNLNLFITKRFFFFFSSFALIALKERYRYPPQIWGKRKEKRSKRRRGALSSFACQLAFFFFG